MKVAESRLIASLKLQLVKAVPNIQSLTVIPEELSLNRNMNKENREEIILVYSSPENKNAQANELIIEKQSPLLFSQQELQAQLTWYISLNFDRIVSSR